LEQQKAAFHQVMEIELQVEKEIQTQEVVDKDTVVVCSSANDDGDHVNKKQQQEIAKKQQRNNWNKAKKNHNVIEYMNYTNISTVQSNEIQYPTFWCYFDPHGNTTRMSNILPKDMEDSKERKINNKDLRMIKKEKEPTPVTIAPAKVSLERINRRAKGRHKKWLRTKNTRKYCLKILEVIPEGEQKAYKFKEQQEAAVVEVERWTKDKSVERQQQLQEKYQQLKHDREQQKKRKKTTEEETITG